MDGRCPLQLHSHHISHFYESSSTLMLRLFGISQVDAVSVLGTLNKDKAAVPDSWRAAAALESSGWEEGPSDGRGRGGMVSGDGI